MRALGVEEAYFRENQEALHRKTNAILGQIMSSSYFPPILSGDTETLNVYFDSVIDNKIDFTENSHINLEDKMIYDATLHSHLTKTISQLMRVTTPNSVEEIYEVMPWLNPEHCAYVTNSKWLKGLQEGTVTKLHMTILEGSKETASGVGVPFDKLKPVDKVITVLNSIQSGMYQLMRPADNASERFIKVEGELLVPITADKSVTISLFKNYLIDELNRTQEDNTGYINLDKNSKEGFILSELLTKDQLSYYENEWKNSGSPQNFGEWVTSMYSDVISNNILTYLNKRVKRLLNYLSDNKVIFISGDQVAIRGLRTPKATMAMGDFTRWLFNTEAN